MPAPTVLTHRVTATDADNITLARFDATSLESADRIADAWIQEEHVTTVRVENLPR